MSSEDCSFARSDEPAQRFYIPDFLSFVSHPASFGETQLPREFSETFSEMMPVAPDEVRI